LKIIQDECLLSLGLSIALSRLTLQVYQCGVNINEKLGVSALFVKVHDVHIENVVEEFLAVCGLYGGLNCGIGLTEFGNGIAKNLSTGIVTHYHSLRFGTRVDNLDVTVGFGSKNLDLLSY
jgi:hypothetical protein